MRVNEGTPMTRKTYFLILVFSLLFALIRTQPDAHRCAFTHSHAPEEMLRRHAQSSKSLFAQSSQTGWPALVTGSPVPSGHVNLPSGEQMP